MAEEKNNEAGMATKPGLDFKIILIGLVLFLVAMGGAYLLLSQLISPLLPEKDVSNQAGTTGNLVSVGEFTTNINDLAGTRFLKVEIYVEIPSDDKKAPEKIDQFMPVIQDSILGIISSKTVADLDVRNRDHLKTEIKQALNHKIGGDLVKNVYFTNFIMQ